MAVRIPNSFDTSFNKIYLPKLQELQQKLATEKNRADEATKLTEQLNDQLSNRIEFEKKAANERVRKELEYGIF